MSGPLFKDTSCQFSNAAHVFRNEAPNSKLLDSIDDIDNKMRHSSFGYATNADYVLALISDAKKILRKMIKELEKGGFAYVKCNNILKFLDNIEIEDVEENIKKNFRVSMRCDICDWNLFYTCSSFKVRSAHCFKKNSQSLRLTFVPRSLPAFMAGNSPELTRL